MPQQDGGGIEQPCRKQKSSKKEQEILRMEWDQVQKPDLDGQKECKSHRKEYFRMDADLPDKKSWKNGIRNAAESASSLDRKRFTRKRIPHKKTNAEQNAQLFQDVRQHPGKGHMGTLA